MSWCVCVCVFVCVCVSVCVMYIVEGEEDFVSEKTGLGRSQKSNQKALRRQAYAGNAHNIH